MAHSIIVFPGQGSQFVGMGKKLLTIPKVARMFEIASDITKKDLLTLCTQGPKNELDKTINCQPAVFVTSLAAVEYLKEANPNAIANCYATAGFSIGEYASLVLAGSISYEDALRVIKVRGEAMQQASESIESGLMTVFLNRQSKLKLGMLAARKWCTEKLKIEGKVECEIANYLNSSCKVIGGNKEALDFIELNYKEFNINKVKRLPVSGAFHTSLMQSAEEPVKAALSQIKINKPLIKFHCNLTSKLVSAPEKIRFNLVKQISNPVKWEQTLNEFYYNENLPTDSNGKEVESVLIENNSFETKKEKYSQFQDRVYPDIYECGPANHSGVILKTINFKAHAFYKHIGV